MLTLTEVAAVTERLTGLSHLLFSSFGPDQEKFKKDTWLPFSSGQVHVHTGFLQTNQQL